MGLDLHLAHLLHGILLFFAVNWLGGHAISAGYLQLSLFARSDEAPAFNLVFRVLTPLVFLILVAAFWHAVGIPDLVKGIWLASAYYIVFRWAFNVAIGRGSLLNWPMQIGTAAVVVAAAFALDTKVLQVRGNILPDPSTLGNELWIVVLLFLYQVANRTRLPSAGTDKRKQRYLEAAYRKYRGLFAGIIEPKAADLQVAVFVYAVLIYEAFNRPSPYRTIERRLLFPFGLSRTTGIMQVRSDHPLSDSESVELGTDRLLAAYRTELAAGFAKWRELMSLPEDSDIPPHVKVSAMLAALALYNIRSDYGSEVLGVYQAIVETFHPELADHTYSGV